MFSSYMFKRYFYLINVSFYNAVKKLTFVSFYFGLGDDVLIRVIFSTLMFPSLCERRTTTCDLFP